MKTAFKRTSEEGVCNTLSKIVSVPLTFVRDYSCPMAEQDAWDRNRAAILPMTLIISFMYLSGYLNGDYDDIKPYLFIGIWSMIPGAFLGLVIKYKTNKSQAPTLLLTIYAFICFFMSIVWINFTSNSIMDML
jgi:hypothetical protein